MNIKVERTILKGKVFIGPGLILNNLLTWK